MSRATWSAWRRGPLCRQKCCREATTWSSRAACSARTTTGARRCSTTDPTTEGTVRPAMQVSIVGAGISGLTLAAALTADGIECQVFEQAAALAEGGAGIQIAPNASRLLHRLGLQARLRAVAVRPAAIEMRRWDDNQLLARTAL